MQNGSKGTRKFVKVVAGSSEWSADDVIALAPGVQRRPLPAGLCQHVVFCR
jgi:hypothetical protein